MTSSHTVSAYREREDGTLVCRNCGCVQGTGHHPTCIETVTQTQLDELNALLSDEIQLKETP